MFSWVQELGAQDACDNQLNEGCDDKHLQAELAAAVNEAEFKAAAVVTAAKVAAAAEIAKLQQQHASVPLRAPFSQLLIAICQVEQKYVEQISRKEAALQAEAHKQVKQMSRKDAELRALQCELDAAANDADVANIALSVQSKQLKQRTFEVRTHSPISSPFDQHVCCSHMLCSTSYIKLPTALLSSPQVSRS
jgi:hypothetical protein